MHVFLSFLSIYNETIKNMQKKNTSLCNYTRLLLILNPREQAWLWKYRFLFDQRVWLKMYSSTVFLCETTEDARYVRCDFNNCELHPLNNTPEEIPGRFVKFIFYFSIFLYGWIAGAELSCQRLELTSQFPSQGMGWPGKMFIHLPGESLWVGSV